MPSESEYSLAIIGGGASAAIMAANLHRSATRAAITIFDRDDRFARGIAYSTQKPEHLLNVRASNMSAFEDDPEHFLRWLRDNNYSYGAIDFVPRMIYGAYLRSVLKSAGDVQLRPEHVINIQSKNGAYEIKTNENVSTFQKVILATGNCAPIMPAGAEILSIPDGYYNSPWQIDYQTLLSAENIIILGTGLSMIDCAASLDATGFKGRITAISRHGLIPMTHTDIANWPGFIAGGMPASVYEILKLVRDQIEMAQEQNIPWQVVIDSLRPFSNRVWTSWDQKEQQKFRKRIAPYWKIHRHRMAPEVAAIIQKLKDAKKLFVQSDRVISVSKTSESLLVIGKRDSYKADIVINCLGYGTNSPFSSFSENTSPGLFALGPALAGIYIETTAIPEIRSQAAAIAARIDAEYENNLAIL
jgi:uncharacterized NAD(P)/FAD-binding protein YdhS